MIHSAGGDDELDYKERKGGQFMRGGVHLSSWVV